MQGSLRGGPRPQSGANNGAKAKAFVKQCTMASAKSTADRRRQANFLAAEEELLNRPPADRPLIQVNLVIPGKHMLPRNLDDPAALNAIRRTHRVWITRPQPNILVIHSDDTQRLQCALKDLNWTIHDMRRSDEIAVTRFVTQQPANMTEDVLVKVELNARPYMAGNSRTPDSGETLPVALGLFHELAGRVTSSAESLRRLTVDLKMRVNFGSLQVRRRKRTLGNEMTYADFAHMVSQYAIRGGAHLDKRLPDVQRANKVIQHIVNPAAGLYYPDMGVVRSRCTVLLKIQDHDLVSEAEVPFTENVGLSTPMLARPEPWPRLNWTVAAPDMKLDWNFEVGSFHTMEAVPHELRSLTEHLVLVPSDAGSNQTASLSIPKLVARGPGSNQVKETMLKVSILVPFQDTPYIVEISTTQAWAGMKTSTEPRTWWGMEFYGRNWDESINYMSPGNRKKDWGSGLQTIWPGDAPGLEPRFMSFLEHILQVQSAVGKVDFGQSTTETST
ncbi:hypothetical protein DCS_07919 [Drechmeria coniospora]|uniref:Uncharacterized protein n=1 Tax=Drechmeria coniospora TaxID=98403 RepID=A0A151GFU4_DRECN|nr:hypothetical protein DCS_07919 [Drechmeria coniospora]KYK55954.1 hypothetical protein DCS_07919 [Drechmeria coniospora]